MGRKKKEETTAKEEEANVKPVCPELKELLDNQLDYLEKLCVDYEEFGNNIPDEDWCKLDKLGMDIMNLHCLWSVSYHYHEKAYKRKKYNTLDNIHESDRKRYIKVWLERIRNKTYGERTAYSVLAQHIILWIADTKK